MESRLPSFRDPSGRLFSTADRIFRIVHQSGQGDLNAFLSSDVAKGLVDAGKIVSTRTLSPEEIETLERDVHLTDLLQSSQSDIILEHERVSFPSFPYEWPPEMLHAAACMTIELARRLLSDGLGLKDATPYNILFKGPKPVFIDVLSFEKRTTGDSVWLPYAQFVRTFLLPLLVNSRFSMPIHQVFATRRDGLEPEDVYRLCSSVQRLLPPFLTSVSLPVWLNSKAEKSSGKIYQKKVLDDPEKARFILESIMKSIERSLSSLAPRKGKRSTWSEYMSANESYVADDFVAKQEFVSSVAGEYRPKRVLDVGCNTGHFSVIAAEHGAQVVAIDYDPVVVGELWRQAYSAKLDILPLVVNITRPSPAYGWRNMENPSFLSRACGEFDAVFMLAVVHHMLVSERIPLPEIISLASELTTDLAIIEYVDPEDPMFRRLTRGRDELFHGLTQEVFERECSDYFTIVRSLPLPNTKRCLYLLQKK